MRSFSMAFGSAFLLASAVGCLHKGSNNSSAKFASPYEESDQDLTSDLGSRPLPAKSSPCAELANSMCTFQYAPVICVSPMGVIEGGNDCEAKKNAQKQACDANQAFDSAALECFPKAKAEECDKLREPCTREYSPAACRLEAGGTKLETSGSNACEARNNLARLLCLKDAQGDKAQAVCSPVTAKK